MLDPWIKYVNLRNILWPTLHQGRSFKKQWSSRKVPLASCKVGLSQPIIFNDRAFLHIWPMRGLINSNGTIPLFRPRQGKVIESSNDNHQRSLEASYSSFTQESAVTFDQDSLDSRNGSGLLQWSNVIVLAVSIASAFAIITGTAILFFIYSNFIS